MLTLVGRLTAALSFHCLACRFWFGVNVVCQVVCLSSAGCETVHQISQLRGTAFLFDTLLPEPSKADTSYALQNNEMFAG